MSIYELGGVAVADLKNVYDKVMECTSSISGSSKNFGSMKKNTGMSTSSLGSNRCSSKQKHWILLKYKPAFMGNTLYVETPITGSSLLLVAV